VAETRAVLIYDGDCALCSGCAAWAAARLSSADSVAIVSARDWAASAPSVVLEHGELTRAAWWIEDDQRFEGARAISHVLQRLSGPWAVVGRALASAHVAPIADLVYRTLARHRHRRVREPVEPGGCE